MAKRTGSALLTPETVKKIQPFLITDKQFADLLQVSVRTIHARAASDPTFPVSVRVGRSRRWVLEEAEACAAAEHLATSHPDDAPSPRLLNRGERC